ncbi:MAG: hydroxyethylthiazole kinase [Ktedonobacteraceae bacterium]
MKQNEDQPASLLLAHIRERKPLIHHITNMVTMNDSANITLAIGALPVMAHAIEEVEEMVSLAGALVLNIGTLDLTRIEAMMRAGKRANERGIPIVLDPVGVGATRFRTQCALRLLKELRIAVVRGNAAEMAALVGVAAEIRGVESLSIADDSASLAPRVAREFACVAALTGVYDYVSDGKRIGRIENGHPLLASITGSGCMSSSLVAAFLSVEPDAFSATVAALVMMGLAGEVAALKACGPGTFRAHLLDAVAGMDEASRIQKQKVSIT